MVPESPPPGSSLGGRGRRSSRPKEEPAEGRGSPGQEVLCVHPAAHCLLAVSAGLGPATCTHRQRASRAPLLPCGTRPGEPVQAIQASDTGDTSQVQPRGTDECQEPGTERHSHTRGHTRAHRPGLGDTVTLGSRPRAPTGAQTPSPGHRATPPSGIRARAHSPGHREWHTAPDRPCARCWRPGETAALGGTDVSGDEEADPDPRGDRDTRTPGRTHTCRAPGARALSLGKQ